MEKVKVTTNHKEIESWAMNNGGEPEIIDAPEEGSDAVAIRINFPGRQDDIFLGQSKPARKSSWRDFFKEFERMQLAFIYEENPKREDLSMTYRFIKREEAKGNKLK